MGIKNCMRCGKELERGDKNTYCEDCRADIRKEIEDKRQGNNEQSGSVENASSIVSEKASPETVVKKKKITTKKIVIASIVLAVICGASLFGISMHKSQQYADNMSQAYKLMIEGGSEAEDMCNLTESVWYDSIWDEVNDDTYKYIKGTSDFNDALSNLYADEDISNKITEITTNQLLVQTVMKLLKNPSSKYKVGYNELVKMYDSYMTITELAISPTGSYTTFTQDFSDADSELSSEINLVMNLLP